MKDKSKIFRDIISDKDFSKIKENANNNTLDHPILYLLKDDNEYFESNNYRSFTCVNTKNAINHLYENHHEWLKKIGKKFLEKDFTGVSAALGEIRCFGYLAECFGSKNVSNIIENNKPTPDFTVNVDSICVNVEVNTVQQNQEEVRKLREFYDNCKQDTNLPTVREYVSHPFGIKPTASITQSVILKMISVKEKNHQLKGDTPSVLWIDLQDQYINTIADRIEKPGPFFSELGYGPFEGIFSNELWYSLYGKKDDPVFEGQTLNPDEGTTVKLNKNIHFGKFQKAKYSNISAVVFSGPNSLAIFENPKAKQKLPHLFIEKLSSGRWFKIECCRINYPNKHLKKKIKEDRDSLNKLGKKHFYS